MKYKVMQSKNFSYIYALFDDDGYLVYDWYSQAHIHNGCWLKSYPPKYHTVIDMYNPTNIKFNTIEEFLSWYAENYFVESL